MVKLAITGGIACGKSLAGEFLTELGCAVCDTDEVAHRLLQPGGRVHGQVVGAFGPGILGADGSIDRRALGAVVFRDARARERLNALTHPAVFEEVERWLALRASLKVESAAVIVPLLYESGMTRGWDAVLCVAASRSVQLRRLRERGWTEEEALVRMGAQLPLREKVARADYVVLNNGSRALLKEQIGRIWTRVLETRAWARTTTE